MNRGNRCDPPKISVDLDAKSAESFVVEPNNVPKLLRNPRWASTTNRFYETSVPSSALPIHKTSHRVQHCYYPNLNLEPSLND